MAKKPSKRPRFEIDGERVGQLKELSAASWTREEIAKFFKVSVRTLDAALKRNPKADKLFERGPGKPRFRLDDDRMDEIEKLAGLQCTQKDMAAFFGVTEGTFIKALNRQEEAREAIEAGRGKGRVSLRRSQFRLAEKNATMNIFLSKNHLGMKDTPDENTGSAEEIGEAFATARAAMVEATVGEGPGDDSAP